MLWYVCVGGKLIFQLLVSSPSDAALLKVNTDLCFLPQNHMVLGLHLSVNGNSVCL